MFILTYGIFLNIQYFPLQMFFLEKCFFENNIIKVKMAKVLG
jgi:hypothetical protein